MRILVVEDDEKTAFFIIKGLKQAGFAVDYAGNGEDGLHLALDNHMYLMRWDHNVYLLENLYCYN